jgi:sterol desaturase/sphingolipid hydroxylase (fatty acid hydroxylase superfamily)
MLTLPYIRKSGRSGLLRATNCGTNVSHTWMSYYAELFVYPVVVVGLLSYDLSRSGLALHAHWWLAVASGVMIWTLAEYLVHRFVYHKIPVLRELHGMHHSHPCDLIGAPIWVSIVIFSSFFLLIVTMFSAGIARATTGGLIAGYLCYLLIHDAVHRWQLAETSWLRRHRLRHLRHHRCPEPGNFGVTTGIWDFLFGTLIEPRRPGE